MGLADPVPLKYPEGQSTLPFVCVVRPDPVVVGYRWLSTSNAPAIYLPGGGSFANEICTSIAYRIVFVAKKCVLKLKTSV